MSFCKKLPFAIGSLLFALPLSGASIDERVSALELQASDFYAENAMGRYGIKTAEAGAKLSEECGHWFATIDALFFRMAMGGTEFAWRTNQPAVAPGNPTLPLRGPEKDMDYNWDWGLRVGLGYQFEYDGWDLYTEFTYFETNNSTSVGSGLNDSLVPQRAYSLITSGGAFNQFSNARNAKSKMDFDFLRLDVELGRNYFISPKISLRPHFGPTAAWLDIKQKIAYKGGAVENGGLDINSVHVRDEMNLDVVGPRLGLDTDWFIGSGFSLFANAAGALFYGYYDIEHCEKFTAISNNRVEIDSTMHRFLPMAEMKVGLAWERYWEDNTYHTVISFGFETQYWWRANQFFYVSDAATLQWQHFGEDLMLYGLDLRFRIDF